MIKILEQDFLSEKGRRTKNEDNGGWDSGKIYVVCDGVGGNEKGEVASEIVVNTFIEEFKNNPDQVVNQVLATAELNMLNYLEQNPQASGMATTLTLLRIRDNGIFAAWVGDSRIYQFRKDKILFQSRDHSWVNDAVDAGIITLEESINHPKSNIITRAVQGAQKPAQADEVQLTDIDTGDYFFLCSDGVLETWDDMELTALFAQNLPIQEMTQKIMEECRKISRDNYTAIIFKIEQGLPPVARKPEPIYLTQQKYKAVLQQSSQQQKHQVDITNRSFRPQLHVIDTQKNDEEQNDDKISFSINKKSLKRIGIILVLLGILGVLFWLFKKEEAKPSDNSLKNEKVDKLNEDKSNIENSNYQRKDTPQKKGQPKDLINDLGKTEIQKERESDEKLKKKEIESEKVTPKIQKQDIPKKQSKNGTSEL
jgi:protein phosphatase